MKSSFVAGLSLLSTSPSAPRFAQRSGFVSSVLPEDRSGTEGLCCEPWKLPWPRSDMQDVADVRKITVRAALCMAGLSIIASFQGVVVWNVLLNQDPECRSHVFLNLMAGLCGDVSGELERVASNFLPNHVRVSGCLQM